MSFQTVHALKNYRPLWFWKLVLQLIFTHAVIKLNPAANNQMKFDRIKWILEVINRAFCPRAITPRHRSLFPLTGNAILH